MRTSYYIKLVLCNQTGLSQIIPLAPAASHHVPQQLQWQNSWRPQNKIQKSAFFFITKRFHPHAKCFTDFSDNNEQRLYHRKSQLPLNSTQPQGMLVSKAALRKIWDLGNLYAEKQMLRANTNKDHFPTLGHLHLHRTSIDGTYSYIDHSIITGERPP